MRFFLDRNISPLLANFLNAWGNLIPGIFEFQTHQDLYGRNDERDAGKGDVLWLEKIRSDGTWDAVLTNDSSMRSRPHERKAVLSAGCHVFDLHLLLSHRDLATSAEQLLRVLPKIIKLIENEKDSYWQVPKRGLKFLKLAHVM